jgi:hypothetical protein
MLMKGHTAVMAALLVVFLLAPTVPGWTQAKMWMTPAEIMAALKPGQWVKVEGVVQKDFSVLSTQLQFMTGDFLDDDWSLTGVVRKVDPEKQEMEILRLPVKAQKDTEYENDAGTFKSFAQVKTGMFLEIEGTYLKDGTFLAKELEDESEKLAEDSSLENSVEAEGKVEKVDVSGKTLTLMGITFQISDKTKSRSVIK